MDPDFRPEKKKKSKIKAFLGSAIVLLLLIGVVVYYTWPGDVAGENIPPTLEISSANLQGAFVDDKIAFYTFEEKDQWEEGKKTQLSDNFGRPTALKSGIHFYWLKSPRSFKDIRDFIEPKKGNQIFVAFYSPGEDDWSKGFHVYPKGPFSGTIEIKESDLDAKEIPAYRPFVIISREEVRVWGVESETKSAAQFPRPLKSSEKGWVQVVSTDDVSSAIASYEDRVELNNDGKVQIWYQDAENSFKRADGLDKVTLGEYTILWLKLKERESLSPAS